ncbi:MAG: hypothetical protein HRU28_14900 [Rhizobiales bacterium]|nr:hypothetical protein [Hyphomicrobiales bacterium]
MGTDVRKGLINCIDEADANDAVKAVVLHAVGRIFPVGVTFVNLVNRL